MPVTATVPLHTSQAVSWCPERRGEPVTVGVPLPDGAVQCGDHVVFVDRSGTPRPGQLTVLDQWESGAVRWALCDGQIDVRAGQPDLVALQFSREPSEPMSRNRLVEAGSGLEVDTGRARFRFEVGDVFPCAAVRETSTGALAGHAAFELTVGGRRSTARLASARLVRSGPWRTEVELRATLDESAAMLDVSARVELFAGTSVLRIALTIANPRAAQHPGGTWGLDDPSTVVIESAAISMPVATSGQAISYTAEFGGEPAAGSSPFEIVQASSGGEHWNSRTHVGRDGRVTLPFRGYRLRSGTTAATGLRASPVVDVASENRRIVVAVPDFWQEFPRAIAVTDRALVLGLFPEQAPPAELQGGERKTHRMTIAFGADTISELALAWCHDPADICPSVDWVCRTGAVPYLVPAAIDPRGDYRVLVNDALDPITGFVAKREAQDEYGWRHFGDLPADHESAFRGQDEPFISHYNNQYDALAGCLIQFWSTGDTRWRRLGDELARHVRDIDIYHTDLDKAAYNHGLFWHTAHYVDAGTSTHRTYPPGGAGSGGPSAEHNYNTGLMWHYFLTGEEASRDAAVELGRWVCDMDDGGKTVFRYLASGPTGLAGRTADYYGPGRGAGHSILALLAAFRLTSAREFLVKAEELIRRTAHPADDIAARDLTNAELRWSYTVFLQSLGAYLDIKRAHGQEDAEFAYARGCLLHYARWMLVHEKPFLEHPERLEFPTETWAAQDMRKAEVLLSAAIYAGSSAEREACLDRGQFFFDYAVGTLRTMPTHVFTRPTVLLLSNGYRYAWLAAVDRILPAIRSAPDRDFGRPSTFTPQKQVAIRRAIALAVAGTIAMLAAMTWLLVA